LLKNVRRILINHKGCRTNVTAFVSNEYMREQAGKASCAPIYLLGVIIYDKSKNNRNQRRDDP
jgi:hypothetical protein